MRFSSYYIDYDYFNINCLQGMNYEKVIKYLKELCIWKMIILYFMLVG